MGYLDEDGYLFITGRKKNLIILSNGVNVSPEEVEKELKERGINAELRYSKGRMRIVYQGRILFRNIKFK